MILVTVPYIKLVEHSLVNLTWLKWILFRCFHYSKFPSPWFAVLCSLLGFLSFHVSVCLWVHPQISFVLGTFSEPAEYTQGPLSLGMTESQLGLSTKGVSENTPKNSDRQHFGRGSRSLLLSEKVFYYPTSLISTQMQHPLPKNRPDLLTTMSALSKMTDLCLLHQRDSISKPSFSHQRRWRT